MKNLFNRFVREEEGQDLIEYALLAGFISLVAVAALTTTGSSLHTLFGNVAEDPEGAATFVGTLQAPLANVVGVLEGQTYVVSGYLAALEFLVARSQEEKKA